MEESEDTTAVSRHPSLPPNYVTLSMLKERWLQRKQEEEEGKLKKQQQNPQQNGGGKEGIGSGSKDGVTPTTRNQNRGKSGPDYVPRPRRRQESEKDRRGGEGWVRKHEEPESSGSVVVGGSREIKEKKHWEGRKPRALQNLKSPENVAKKEEIAMVVSEESGGKGKIVDELQLGGDNAGVSVGMIEVVSENGVERDNRKGFGRGRRTWKERRGGFKRNDNRRMNSKAHKQVGELGENEKKAEEGVLGVAEDKCEKGEKGAQSGMGQSSLKIDQSSQDLLLDGRKDGNVRMMVSGQQQGLNSEVYKQVGELGENEKKAERVVRVAEDRREKGENGRQSGIGQSSVKIDKSSQDLLLGDRKDGNVRMRFSGQRQRMNSKVHKRVGEFGENEKKAEEGVVEVAEDKREKGEKGRQSGIGQPSVKIDNSSQDLLFGDRKDGNVRMRVSGQRQSMNSKVHKQVGEFGENEKKAEEGVVEVAEDKSKRGEKGRQSGIGQSSVKIDKSSQDLLLVDRKDGNVRMRVSGQQQSMNSKVHKQVGEFGENEKKAEEGVVEVAEDKSKKGEKGRQSGIGQSSGKIDKSSQDLLLDDRKDGNVGMMVSSQQQQMNSKVHKQVGEIGDEEKKLEEGVVRVANDGRQNGEDGRIRTGTGPWAKNVEKRFRNLSLDNRRYGNVRMRVGGSAGGRWGYVGHRRMARERVEQVENRFRWVKKGENSSGNVTESNSQVSNIF